MTFEWLAGFVDGEGWIGLSTRTHGGRTYKYARLHVSNTHHATMRKLHRIFGGRLYLRKKSKNVNWKQTMEWMVNGQEALHLLRKLLPHLTVKRKAAQLVLRKEK
jgi:hypothetical protein